MLRIFYKRNNNAYSLIEVMTVIVVIGVVLGLLFAYSDQGWKLFYQNYSRGLSQIKAKLAIRLISDELREANKDRVAVGRGTNYGIPFPDDATSNSPYLYFTKPIIHESTGEITGYDYVLYYYAKPKKLKDLQNRKINDEKKYSILKSVKFLNQSKFYTEDPEKTWPFIPPLMEIQRSRLPEDEYFVMSLPDKNEEETEGENVYKVKEEEEFLDHFARLKKESRNIPISGNFEAFPLTDPFSQEEGTILFGQEYKASKIIKISVEIKENSIFFGLMSAKSEFEVKIVPRN